MGIVDPLGFQEGDPPHPKVISNVQKETKIIDQKHLNVNL